MKRATTLLSTSYRYFLAVAEAGSIRAGAREMNIAASAVNRQILILEREIGVDLFERVGRGLVLSEAGLLLRKELGAILEGYDDTAAQLNAFRGLKRGRLRIATVESLSVNRLPDILEGFWAMYPGIEAAVTVTGSEAVTDLVTNGDADVGFTFNPVSTSGLNIFFERDYRIGALMVPVHPLASREALELADVALYPLALPARGLSLRAALDPVLARLDPPIRPRMEANTLRLMAELARRERVVAFQTTVGIEHELADGTLVLIPLTDPELPLDRLVIIASSQRAPSLAVAAFQDFLKAWPETDLAAPFDGAID